MTNKPNHDIELAKALSEWKGQKIHITKEQNRDIDETEMLLNEASFHDRTPTIDGYVAAHVLQLHGQGSILTDNQTNEPLPYLTYDIPMEAQYSVNYSGNQIRIESTDGKYTINKTS